VLRGQRLVEACLIRHAVGSFGDVIHVELTIAKQQFGARGPRRNRLMRMSNNRWTISTTSTFLLRSSNTGAFRRRPEESALRKRGSAGASPHSRSGSGSVCSSALLRRYNRMLWIG